MKLVKGHLLTGLDEDTTQCVNCKSAWSGLMPDSPCQFPGKYLEEVAGEIAPMMETDDRNAWSVGDRLWGLPPPALAELAVTCVSSCGGRMAT
jgi:hypothetical protein